MKQLQHEGLFQDNTKAHYAILFVLVHHMIVLIPDMLVEVHYMLVVAHDMLVRVQRILTHVYNLPVWVYGMLALDDDLMDLYNWVKWKAYS